MPEIKPRFYKLWKGLPVPVDDVIEWAKWFKTADRVVAQENISEDIMVSTVFLGCDESFGLNPRPLIFETLVFGGKCGGMMDRYSTWGQAERGHAKMVEKVKRQKVKTGVVTKIFSYLKGVK